MNLKSKIISLAIIIFLFASGSAYSQGVFKDNQPKTTTESTTTNDGIFKAPPLPPGEGRPGDPQTPVDTPVGEGFLLLSLLSGGYFMLKRRNTKK